MGIGGGELDWILGELLWVELPLIVMIAFEIDDVFEPDAVPFVVGSFILLVLLFVRTLLLLLLLLMPWLLVSSFFPLLAPFWCLLPTLFTLWWWCCGWPELPVCWLFCMDVEECWCPWVLWWSTCFELFVSDRRSDVDEFSLILPRISFCWTFTSWKSPSLSDSAWN